MGKALSNSIHAFICYRRKDAFIGKMPNGQDDVSFVQKISDALVEAGFAEPFWDKRNIHVLDHYESTAFAAIEGCDLFVALIGANWLSLLSERTNRRDAVVREIRAALELEKNILIVTVDGAEVPSFESLPREIQKFHYSSGIQVRTTDTVRAIAKAISEPVADVTEVRRIGSWWKTFYIVCASLAWFFCGFFPNFVGLTEYGTEPWLGMAMAWGGFFIWPAIFLPFLLWALYRPFTTLAESVVRAAPHFGTASIYIAPLAVSTLLAALAWTVEVFDKNQAPWTIIPSVLQPGCQYGPSLTVTSQIADGEGSATLNVLASYDKSDVLKRRYQSPFWTTDKCWPNVFFYLTFPTLEYLRHSRNAADAGNKSDGVGDAEYVKYFAERSAVQISFLKMLRDDYRISIGVPNSRTAWAYRISFAIIVWLGLSGVVMAGFYFAVRIRDPRSQELRKLPSENAFICLTYSLATSMTWIPFRMNTEYVKYIYRFYGCADGEQCGFNATYYIPDMLLGSMIVFGLIFCVLGLLARYRRIVLSILGILMIGLSGFAGWIVYEFKDDIAQLAELWQFYAMLAVPSIVIFFILWLVFDPDFVRKIDFRRDIDVS